MTTKVKALGAHEVERALAAYASPAKAASAAGFFKTGPGQYGEGDRFIGVTVPEQRTVAKQYRELTLLELSKLLSSPVHEHRLTALLILTYKVEAVERDIALASRNKNAPNAKKEYATYMNGRSYMSRLTELAKFYLTYLDRVNNWDLVDLSAPNILGRWCLTTGKREKLYTLARSKSLWRKRIAIVTTHAFIKEGDFSHTFAIAEVLLYDRHDLIHKAVGWMLREAGKRDKKVLERFLKAHAQAMPRTMLRYAIERMEDPERKRWMRAGR